MLPTTDGILAQMRKGVLEYCVLAYLRDGPSYGLEIATRLGGSSPLFGSEGTLYPLLARLRKQGWVETSWQESPAGPPRRYYALTPAGGEALAAFERTWPEFRRGVDTALKGVR